MSDGQSDYEQYYGGIYASKPNAFTFTRAERRLIGIIAAHFKKIVHVNEVEYSNLQYFAEKIQDKKLITDNTNNGMPPLLNKLIESANFNGNRQPNGHRFDSSLQNFQT